jgi:FtsH-binding integral membrane protein
MHRAEQVSRDLSAIGSFLVVGLIRNLVSSLVNIFMVPSAL